ncbi:hypothetical protein ACFFJ4_22895, partial [Xanthomonas dyei]
AWMIPQHEASSVAHLPCFVQRFPSTLLSARPKQENRTSHRPVYLYSRLADVYTLNSTGTKAVPAAKSSVQGASAGVNGEYEFAPSVLDYGRRNNFFGAENVFN